MNSIRPLPSHHPQTPNAKPRRKPTLWLRIVLGILGVLIVGMVTLALWVTSSPSAAASGADWLRNILGPQPVAALESSVFTVQDFLHRAEFSLSRSTPSSPFAGEGAMQKPPFHTLTPNLSTATQTLSPKALITATLEAETASPTPLPATATPQAGWKPANLQPMGSLAGEGVWLPYLADPQGTIVGYETFLQPDAKRPYVTVAIVAVNLAKVRLHYQLGLEEPSGTYKPARTGSIPQSDMQSGRVLAAFNGGFKTVNGNYGVMFNGYVIVDPIVNMGTLAIYKDGSLSIGEWDNDLRYSNDMQVIRQNCPLLIHDGEINPQVYNDSGVDWGATVDGVIVTFRSGIGLSQDGSTLYYFAGQNVNMPVLAAAMQDTGVYQAMQLDINNYYVLFTRFANVQGALHGQPLLPKDMTSNLDRFLHPYSRDFFYLTLNQS